MLHALVCCAGLLFDPRQKCRHSASIDPDGNSRNTGVGAAIGGLVGKAIYAAEVERGGIDERTAGIQC